MAGKPKIRLGVIGAGSWAVSSHLPNFQEYEDVEFVAVSRLGASELARVKDHFGFEYASEDYRDVLAHDLDVVLVSSPSAYHFEHARAALEAGAHLLVEKPVTIDPADAWELVELSKKTGREIVVAFGWNYREMVQQAKEIMASPGIGLVESVSIHMASPTRELLSDTGAYPDADPYTLPESKSWTNSKLSGGGYGQAQLSHALGMALWLLDERVSGAFALMSAPLNAPVELHDAVSMTFDSGAIGSMFGGSNWVGAGDNKHQLVINAIGSEGQFRIDVEREDLWLYRGDGVEIRPGFSHPAGLYDCVGPVRAILDFARGKSVINYSPIDLGARTVEALDLIYQSAANKAFIKRG